MKVLLQFAVVRLAGELHKNIRKKAVQHYVATREDLEPFWKSDTWESTYREWLGQLVADPDRCDIAELRQLLLLLTVAPYLNGGQGRYPDGFGEEDLAEAWGVDVEELESEVREQGNWTLPEDLVELTWLTGPEPEDRWTRRLYHVAGAGEDVPLCEAEVEDLRELPARPDGYPWRPCGECQSALIDMQTSAEGDESEEETGATALQVPGNLPEDPKAGCRLICEQMMDVNPDVTNEDLYDACVKAFPEEVQPLALRQFHARYPLQVKRDRAEARGEEVEA